MWSRLGRRRQGPTRSQNKLVGVSLYSFQFLKQLNLLLRIYFRLPKRAGRDAGGTGTECCLHRNDRSNGRGRSFAAVSRSTLPFRFERITGMSPANSQIIWRQGPHGGVSFSVSQNTAMASNSWSPSEMALKIATRSAQRVRP